MISFAELQALSRKAEEYSRENMNEETTKHVLVEPFLKLLGWNPNDPRETKFEHGTGYGTQNDNRIDIVAMDRPRHHAMLIECKAQNVALNSGKSTQLRFYFGTQDGCIGVLTNGVVTQFFADFDKPNVMDAEPFLEVDLRRPDRKQTPILELLSKQNWDVEKLKDRIRWERLRKAVKDCLMDEFRKPSDDLAQLVAGRCSADARRSVSAEDVKPLLADVFKSMLPRGLRDMLNLDSGKAEPADPKPDDPLEQKEAERLLLGQYSDEARRIYDALFERLQKETGGFQTWFGKQYGNFKREQNVFMSVVSRRGIVRLTINLPAGSLQPDADIVDISGKGKWGVGNYAVNLSRMEDIDRFMPLLMRAWDAAAPAERQEQRTGCAMH